MYEDGKHRGYTNNSVAKQALDSWYQSNLLSYDDKIADAIYCNDRTMFSGDSSNTPISNTGLPLGASEWKFGAYLRMYNYNPSLVCPHIDDSFTVADTNKGNGKLTYKVGLITIDELVMAGATEIQFYANVDFYLHVGNNFWTMSPHKVQNSSTWLYAFSTFGIFQSHTTGTNFELRPVISLKSNVKFTGTGKWNDPYLVI